jgi:K+-sensing histidine kinase KdpD
MLNSPSPASGRTQGPLHMFRGTPDPSAQSISSAQQVTRAMGQPNQDLLDVALLDALSTDLREPLAVIKGASETLLRRGERLSPEERHEFLSAIVEASECFEGILQRVLPSNMSS